MRGWVGIASLVPGVSSGRKASAVENMDPCKHGGSYNFSIALVESEMLSQVSATLS